MIRIQIKSMHHGSMRNLSNTKSVLIAFFFNVSNSVTTQFLIKVLKCLPNIKYKSLLMSLLKILCYARL